MKNEVIKDFYYELVDLYKYDKKDNKKLLLLECISEKLSKIDRSSEQDLNCLVEMIEFGNEFDTDNIVKINSLLDEMKTDIVNNMFLRNTIFKKMIVEEVIDPDD